MSEYDDLFSAMETSSSAQAADFFKPGNYVVAPKSFEVRRGGYRGDSFIARFAVKESNNPDIPVGSTRSWIMKLDGTPDKKKRALGDIKNFFFALQGIEPTSVPPFEKDKEPHQVATILFKAAIDANYAAENELDHFEFVGKSVCLEAVETEYEIQLGPRKGEKAVFTKHFWGPAKAQAA